MGQWLTAAAGGTAPFVVRAINCDPPFDIPSAVDGKGYWLRPIHAQDDGRRKILRKQLFTGVVLALSALVRQQSRVVLGYGQGGLVAAMLSMPLVVEASCRARIVTDVEMLDIRRAWAGLEWIIVVDPLVLPQRTEWSEVTKAVPELLIIQPGGS